MFADCVERNHTELIYGSLGVTQNPKCNSLENYITKSLVPGNY